LGATVVFLLGCMPAWAQDATADPDPPSLKTKVRNAIGAALTQPVYPVFKGVGPDGNLGIGLGYDSPMMQGWRTTTSAAVTTRRSWELRLDTAYDHPRFAVVAYARLREMSKLNFFGLGAASRVDDHATFGLRDSGVGALVIYRVTSFLSAGGRVEQWWPTVGRGSSVEDPSIEERFGGDVPGAGALPRFGVYQGFAEFTVPSPASDALNQGGTYRATYGAYEDHEFDRFTFQRLDVEAQQQVAGFGPHQRLVLGALVSTTRTAPGQAVPFFLQPTLGGEAPVTSVEKGELGIDGPRAVLRGARSLRFRDRHLMLFQAEYRVPVWGPLVTSVFVDAGTVAHRLAALNLSGLQHSYGVGVDLMRGTAAAARLDVGRGGSDGTRLTVSVGNVLP
jgi:hypothetical protein